MSAWTQVARRSEQFETDQQREEAADEKEKRNGDEIEQRDALVVGGEQPRPHSVLFVQVVLAFEAGGLRVEGSR